MRTLATATLVGTSSVRSSTSCRSFSSSTRRWYCRDQVPWLRARAHLAHHHRHALYLRWHPGLPGQCRQLESNRLAGVAASHAARRRRAWPAPGRRGGVVPLSEWQMVSLGAILVPTILVALLAMHRRHNKRARSGGIVGVKPLNPEALAPTGQASPWPCDAEKGPSPVHR